MDPVSYTHLDVYKRQVQGECQRLRVGNTDQQCTRQAGTLGNGDGIEIGEVDPGFGQRSADDRNDIAQMLAGGEFRNHAAIRRVGCDLRGHDTRERVAPALHYRCSRLITGAFDGENQAAARAGGISAFSAGK